MGVRCWVEHLDGSRQRVPEGGLLLGRSAECSFRIVDARVAPHHVRVEILQGRAFLSPCPGASTYLNGAHQVSGRPLRDGDWIGLAPGLLFCVRVREDADAVPWLVTAADGAAIRLDSTRSEAILTPGVRLLWLPDQLMMDTTTPLQRNGVALPADGRRWSLDVGDVLQVGAQRWEITGGRQPWAPQAWTGWHNLLYTPASAATLWPDVGLRLCFGQETRWIPLEPSFSALVQGLVAAERTPISPAVLGGATALRALRSALLRAGVDGFSLIAASHSGTRVQLALQEGAAVTVATAAPPTHASPMQESWWLEGDDGTCMCLDAGGLLIGRHEECDLHISAPHIHRHHALVRLRRQGTVELAPLGRHPTYLDMAPLEGSAALPEGAELRLLSDHILHLRRYTHPAPPCTPYRLTTPTGEEQELDGQDTWLGSASGPGQLSVSGWPPRAVRLIRLPAALLCLPSVPLLVSGQIVLPGHARRLGEGDTLRLGDGAVQAPAVTITALTLEPEPPQILHIVAQSIPRAGRVLVRLSDGARARVCLIGRRFQLISLLLEASISSRLRGVIRTKSSLDAVDTGDDIPHGAMRLRDVRMELTQQQRLTTASVLDLIHVCRAEFVAAGIDGERLIELQEDWVRLAISPACNVDLYR